MKKIVLFAVSCFLFSSLFAQDTLRPLKKEPVNLSGRANDHLMVQLGYAGWAGQPDTINTGGFSKSVNVYMMFDFPFKSNPKLSLALGAGIASDHIKFKKTYVGIKETTPTLQFRDQSDTNYFKKTKLATAYFEVPLELRFTANPANSNKSIKVALGVKGGYLLNAHTRNKELRSRSGSTINEYLLKEASKKYFNSTRLAATARIGWGHFSLFGSYQLTNLFKEGVAAQIKPFSIGLTLSGL